MSRGVWMFGAQWRQVLTYLGGVAMGSIATLVFVNATISFVITDIVHQTSHVGDATGTLGFADELVVIVMSPIWGFLSDRIGVARVCFLGFSIIGVSMFGIVNTQHVYPDLLLARVLFSFGAAAVSCMVTAVLPSISATHRGRDPAQSSPDGLLPSPTAPEEAVSEPQPTSPEIVEDKSLEKSASPSRLAGVVGLATGGGALVALLLFLQIPAIIEHKGFTAAKALVFTYYAVGTFSIVLSILCFLGLRNLQDEKGKGYTTLLVKNPGMESIDQGRHFWFESVRLVFQMRMLALAYLGGFVARASSVAITLFVPLYVNHCFISSSVCHGDGRNQKDVKENCSDAFVLSSQLTGISQTTALLFAVLFGLYAERFRSSNLPLGVAAISGCAGYILLGYYPCNSVTSRGLNPLAITIMVMLGFSQIGAIVCSLGLLGRCVLGMERSGYHRGSSRAIEEVEDTAPLLKRDVRKSYKDLKGSIAGTYSLSGGLGILILTKAGGLLFDKVSTAAPFSMIASFNAILVIASTLNAILSWKQSRNK